MPERQPSKILFGEVRKILLQKWDPIGIKDEPRAQDEYDSYIPSICRLLLTNRDRAEIANHLSEIVTVNMGLDDNGDHSEEMKVADALITLIKHT